MLARVRVCGAMLWLSKSEKKKEEVSNPFTDHSWWENRERERERSQSDVTHCFFSTWWENLFKKKGTRDVMSKYIKFNFKYRLETYAHTHTERKFDANKSFFSTSFK